MGTLMEMVPNLLAMLVVAVGTLVMATAAYAKVLPRNMSTKRTSTTTQSWSVDTDIELAIAEFFVVKYCTQAVVSGHYQTAKNLRKQGVPLEVAMMILFGERRDRAA